MVKLGSFLWLVVSFTCGGSFFLPSKSLAQAQKIYTNNWLRDDQPYVRIGVTENGLYRLSFKSLPKEFDVSRPELLQVWHRGKEIAVLSADGTGLTFYAVKNDGALDSSLYRPVTERMNPYCSLFSDESAYFLTTSDKPGKRAKTVNEPPTPKHSLTDMHLARNVVTYTFEYSLSTKSYIRPNFFNSFYEHGASRTDSARRGSERAFHRLELVSPAQTADAVTVKMLFHGRSNNVRNLNIYAGKDDKSMRLVTTVYNSNFEGTECTFKLNLTDFDGNGRGLLGVDSKSTSPEDAYSIAYYEVAYLQKITATRGATLELVRTADPWTLLSLKEPGALAYDITDVDEPIILKGEAGHLMIPRKKDNPLRMFIEGNVKEVPAEKIRIHRPAAISPDKYNYIIITQSELIEGAKEYAAYRSSKEGGGFRVLVVDIVDLYNEFNYGEPSPLAIRHFADFVLSKGSKDKHFFLIGKSVTFNEKMTRELVGEVPTVGFPGADILLVDGLSGAEQNIAAAPIGRLSAFSNAQIRDYLGKVRSYENKVGTDQMWRKNVLHINGGKSPDEVAAMRNVLATIAPLVEGGVLGGKVKAFAKTQGVPEVENAKVTPEVNEGLGLISCIAHGSPIRTDYNIGYITDPDRQYVLNSKYAFMYFNGCGVGNIFSGRSSMAQRLDDARIPLTLDWILAPGRGAIAVMANSFDSYLSVSARYLQELYRQLFVINPGLSIGRIQIEAAKAFLAGGKSREDIANVHQTVLQGDPAIRMFALDNPDYSVHPDEAIRMVAPAGQPLSASHAFEIQAVVENRGRYDATEMLDLKVIIHYSSGKVEQINKTVPAIKYQETVVLAKMETGGEVTYIEVVVDPTNKSKDDNQTNNYSEMVVDWPRANGHSYYPFESVKDIVPPMLSVSFNGRTIQNGEIIAHETSISLTFRDDRSLPFKDNLFDVSIKSCDDLDCPCGENECAPRHDYAKEGALSWKQLDVKSFMVSLKTSGWGDGLYLMTVRSVKDRVGNMSEPFHISFRIQTNDGHVPSLVVSPNPASSYVRFNVKDRPEGPAVIKIFDKNGNVRHKSDFKAGVMGLPDFYWFPTMSGLFFYQIEWTGGKRSSGKFAVVK